MPLIGFAIRHRRFEVTVVVRRTGNLQGRSAGSGCWPTEHNEREERRDHLFPGVGALDVAGPLDVSRRPTDSWPARRVTLPPSGEPSWVRFVQQTGCRSPRTRPSVTPKGATTSFSLPADLSFRNDRSTRCSWNGRSSPHQNVNGKAQYGAFALGYAGLLDGKAVATHWRDPPLLAAQFPRARIELDRIYLRDGRLVTSAGVTAGIDFQCHVCIGNAERTLSKVIG
jgi:hypothetical protein